LGEKDKEKATKRTSIQNKRTKSNLVLSADVPHGEADVLVLDGLDVETNGGDGGDDLTELELVKNGSLTGGIESDHQNTHLGLVKGRRKRLGKS
jgi:hypothetical protein